MLAGRSYTGDRKFLDIYTHLFIGCRLCARHNNDVISCLFFLFILILQRIFLCAATASVHAILPPHRH